MPRPAAFDGYIAHGLRYPFIGIGTKWICPNCKKMFWIKGKPNKATMHCQCHRCGSGFDMDISTIYPLTEDQKYDLILNFDKTHHPEHYTIVARINRKIRHVLWPILSTYYSIKHRVLYRAHQ
jgi:hypothetical protein